jgi:hypothetical protein
MACETEGRDIPKYRGNSSQNFPHQIPKGSITCADKQRWTWLDISYPCITPAAGKRKILFKSAKKAVPVAAVKISWQFNPPGDNMMNRTGDIESSNVEACRRYDSKLAKST